MSDLALVLYALSYCVPMIFSHVIWALILLLCWMHHVYLQSLLVSACTYWLTLPNVNVIHITMNTVGRKVVMSHASWHLSHATFQG